MITICTSHGGNSLLSRTISNFSERSGQWDDSFGISILQKIYGDSWHLHNHIPAPSHAFALIGENDFIEADWGEDIIPFIPFWRKDSGVRRFSRDELNKRDSFTIVWGLDASKKETEKFKDFLIETASWRVKYDFLGLLGASGMTLFKKNYSILEDKGKFFCSELVVEAILNTTGKCPKINSVIKSPSDITPSLLPRAFDFYPITIL